MEAIGLIIAIAIIVFVFGLYADSGSKRESSSRRNEPSIEYYMVSKKG